MRALAIGALSLALHGVAMAVWPLVMGDEGRRWILVEEVAPASEVEIEVLEPMEVAFVELPVSAPAPLPLPPLPPADPVPAPATSTERPSIRAGHAGTVEGMATELATLAITVSLHPILISEMQTAMALVTRAITVCKLLIRGRKIRIAMVLATRATTVRAIPTLIRKMLIEMA